MTTVRYTVPKITCSHCTHTIAAELSEIKGVSNVDADVDTKQVTITFDYPATEQVLKQALAEINYPAA